MLWKLPPKIKIYEALGSIADGRITITKNSAKVWSSNRNKFYTVEYDPAGNAIMSNDNGSYWIGYLGYPAIAFLMAQKKLSYNNSFAKALKGIAWKEINTKFKNDFAKTEKLVRIQMQEKNIDLKKLDAYLEQVLKEIEALKIKKLGKRTMPPRE